jgi:hypothetical protein
MWLQKIVQERLLFSLFKEKVLERTTNLGNSTHLTPFEAIPHVCSLISFVATTTSVD